MTKIGRNDPCICGSGKKYKKCCFQKRQQDHASNNQPPIKISEAILRIAEPLMIKYPKREHITIIIDLAIFAWNISLASGEIREEIEKKVIELMPDEIDAVSIASIIEQTDILVERKNKLYPNIGYFIASYNLSFDNKGQLTLDINSTVTQPA